MRQVEKEVMNAPLTGNLVDSTTSGVSEEMGDVERGTSSGERPREMRWIGSWMMT